MNVADTNLDVVCTYITSSIIYVCMYIITHTYIEISEGTLTLLERGKFLLKQMLILVALWSNPQTFGHIHRI